MAPQTPRMAEAPDTAAVLQFTCLYTHDITRKKKRWQDGRLRFHTFNKRIMVYDLDGNFVDGQHRRTDDTVNAGDGFALDDGVLVQVEEQQRSAKQDLTELVKQRKTKSVPHMTHGSAREAHGLSSRSPPVTARLGSAPSPKSIREVLKGAKPAKGTAVLPYREAAPVAPRGVCGPKGPQPEQVETPRLLANQRESTFKEAWYRDSTFLLPRQRPLPPARPAEDAVRNKRGRPLQHHSPMQRKRARLEADDRNTNSPDPKRSKERPRTTSKPAGAATDALSARETQRRGFEAKQAIRTQRLKGKLRLGNGKRHKLVCHGDVSMLERSPDPSLCDDAPAPPEVENEHALVIGSSGSSVCEVEPEAIGTVEAAGSAFGESAKEGQSTDARRARLQAVKHPTSLSKLPRSPQAGPLGDSGRKEQEVDGRSRAPTNKSVRTVPEYHDPSARILSSSSGEPSLTTTSGTTIEDDESNDGPWSREAFDLFG